jgi:nitrate/nitrite transport system ATP-binding protein
MSLLELSAVSKGYGLPGGGRREVLRHLDLRIEEGECVAIVGCSGAGKTTLVNLLAGLLAPDTGRVQFAGAQRAQPGPERAVVFQSYALLPWLTVLDNVALAVDAAFPEWPAQRRKDQVLAHVARVGLASAQHKRPGQLSGGMRQRVALARALAMDPRVLLLDEPLSALDALTRGKLQAELAELVRGSGKTVVLITNDVDEALLLADRIITLGGGPPATAGAPIVVPLARPRQARALGHDPAFVALRAQIIDELLARRGPIGAAQVIAPASLPLEAEA